MYEIYYTKNARKQISKLPKNIQEHILSVIERTRIRPESYFKRMVGEKTYKLRAGKYRIIADMIKDQLVILIIKVGDRKNIYD